MHVIKRKGHRRLFDTTDHRYVSRAALRHLSRQGEEVVVIDGRTGRDVTRQAFPELIQASALMDRLAERGRRAVAESISGMASAALDVLHLPRWSEVLRVSAQLKRLERRIHGIGTRRRRSQAGRGRRA